MDSNYEAMQSAMIISFDISKLSEEEQKKHLLQASMDINWSTTILSEKNTLSAKKKKN